MGGFFFAGFGCLGVLLTSCFDCGSLVLWLAAAGTHSALFWALVGIGHSRRGSDTLCCAVLRRGSREHKARARELLVQSVNAFPCHWGAWQVGGWGSPVLRLVHPECWTGLAVLLQH